MKKKCSKCQKVLLIELFGMKNNTVYSRCISCRDKERKSYKHIKKSFLDDYSLLKSEWDYAKNEEMKIYPENLSFGSNKKVFWKCETGNPCHVWEACICKRTGKNPRGCPFCSNKKICPCGCNSLYSSNPELIGQWDEEKNGDMKLYAPSSNKKVFWKCETGNPCHVWEASINNRTGKKRNCCPFCSGHKICPCGCNSLYASNPELIGQWDEEKNGSMKLYAPSSNKKVFWKCETGNPCHVWEATVASRTGKKQNGCPFCNKSKLETMLVNVCQKINVKYEEQKRFDDCKNKTHLPYDCYLPEYNLCIEMQGIQHFKYNNFFHPEEDSFLKRLQIDSKKVKSCYKEGRSFLSISYLVDNEQELETILTSMIERVKQNPCIRFQINASSYLEPFTENSMPILTNNDVFSVYEVYDEQRKMVEGNENPLDLSKCIYCDEYHLDAYIKYHYQTEDHYNLLVEKCEEFSMSLIGMTPEGVPIVLEDDICLNSK